MKAIGADLFFRRSKSFFVSPAPGSRSSAVDNDAPIATSCQQPRINPTNLPWYSSVLFGASERCLCDALGSEITQQSSGETTGA